MRRLRQPTFYAHPEGGDDESHAMLYLLQLKTQAFREDLKTGRVYTSQALDEFFFCFDRFPQIDYNDIVLPRLMFACTMSTVTQASRVTSDGTIKCTSFRLESHDRQAHFLSRLAKLF